jgi:hypothetical protein
MAPPATTKSAAADDGVVVIAGRRYLTERRFASDINRSLQTLRRWDLQRIGPERIRVAGVILYEEAQLPGWLSRFETRRRRLESKRGTHARTPDRGRSDDDSALAGRVVADDAHPEVDDAA